MDKPEHTPGPWTLFHDETETRVEGPDLGQRALIGALPIHRFGSADRVPCLSVQDANARLIAAAPALLAALERLQRAYDQKAMTPVHEYAPLWADVRAAIRAAKGEVSP